MKIKSLLIFFSFFSIFININAMHDPGMLEIVSKFGRDARVTLFIIDELEYNKFTNAKYILIQSEEEFSYCVNSISGVLIQDTIPGTGYSDCTPKVKTFCNHKWPSVNIRDINSEILKENRTFIFIHYNGVVLARKLNRNTQEITVGFNLETNEIEMELE